MLKVRKHAMRRREAMIGIGAALAAPGIARAQNSRVLRYVAAGYGVVQLDPLATTAYPTLILALQIFESLYGVDENLAPRPQMAAGHVIEDDGKRWVITVRDGLRFHDGEPVLAQDCVASINRWMKRDSTGRTVAERLDALEATDDRTVVFRLKKPFPQLPFVIGKSSPNMMAVMPARLAAIDPNEAVPELVGSGPFRFLSSEFSANSLTVLARFEGYEPRNEPPSGTAGGRIARVDRVEWRVIPDPATQAAALITGEIDWIGAPLPDLIPHLREDRNIVVQVLDRFGQAPWLRPNHASGPTANVGVRRAIMAALDGKEILAAGFGGDPGNVTAPIGVFCPGSPFETKAGMERLGPKSPNVIKTMLREAGYQNERLALLHQADVPLHDAMLQVIARRLAEAGFNVDDQVTDAATMFKRRASRESPDRRGWSLFFNVFSCADSVNPLLDGRLRTGAAASFGWPDAPVMEELRERWLGASDEIEQKHLAARIQDAAMADVLYVPLGRYVTNSAWRSNVSGILKSNQPVMWNISKS
jgi:peptide/nickel transport system substrate-binding protein